MNNAGAPDSDIIDITRQSGKDAPMTDVLIRQIPETVVIMIDRAAHDLRLSRSEYLRRRIISQHSVSAQAVTLSDLQRASAATSDLLDDEVMSAAWR
jgi:hypothetical protein